MLRGLNAAQKYTTIGTVGTTVTSDTVEKANLADYSEKRNLMNLSMNLYSPAEGKGTRRA